MGILSRKGDPVAEAQADVDKLDAQRGKLVTRLSDLSSRLELARAARRDALVAGDLDDVAMAAVDKAFADATEARAFVEEEITTVTAKLDEVQRHLDGLQDAARRAEIAADAERRAAALDDAAEALAGAAEAFRDARTAMAQAIGEHGIRVENVLMAGGSAPAALLAKPIVMAAIRLAAPGVLPVADGFGDPHVDDPLIAMRRAQSGRLRDHADDIRDGRTPAVEMPRPGSTAPAVDLSRPSVPALGGHVLAEPKARTVFAVPFSYLSTGDTAMLQGEPGDSEVPLRVARKAEELEMAFPPDSPEGRAIVARLKAAGGQLRARPRTFIDTTGDVETAPSAPPRTAAWPDDRSAETRR